MALVTRVLPLPARPIALARALRGAPGLALLHSAWGGGPSYLSCCPVERATGLDPEPGLGLCELGEAGSVPRWIGALPYEAMRHLERPAYTRRPDDRPAPLLSETVWWRYGAVARIAERVEVIGDDAAAVAELSERLLRPAEPSPLEVALAEPIEAGERHAERIRAALELIAAGELYQVNLARRFRLRVRGTALELMAALGARARAPFAACLGLGEVDLVSTSPELFLALDPDRRVRTEPIKGTRPRGTDPVSDAALAAELEADPKERAELAMILDVERNDLGRIAQTGSVRLVEPPRVHTYPTLHHREAVLGARLRAGLGRRELLEAMLPSGSVTGAPKRRAMEVIAQLEPVRRGLYTGAFGFVRHDGGLRLGMAIRTLSLADGEGHYFAGGGIVADSDPAREVEETHWKALQVAALTTPARPDAGEAEQSVRKLGPLPVGR